MITLLFLTRFYLIQINIYFFLTATVAASRCSDLDGLVVGEACYVILNDEPIIVASRAEHKCQEIGATLAIVNTVELYNEVYDYVDGVRNSQDDPTYIYVTLGGTYEVSVYTTIYYACLYPPISLVCD